MEALFKYIRIGLLCLLLTGCQESARDEYPAPPSRTATLEIQFNVKLADNATTRADYELDGTQAENAIAYFDLFVVDLDDSQEEVWGTAQSFRIYTPSWFSSPAGNYQITKRIKTTIGKKRMYVGANMTSAQVDAFIAQQGKLYASSETGYAGIVTDFTGNSLRGMLMTGEVKSAGSTTIDVVASDETTPLAVQTDLYRTAAKVLLTCELIDLEHVSITDPQGSALNGWMKLENVYFALNTVNRRINLMQQTVSGNITDPNYLVSDLVGLQDGKYQVINQSTYNDHFIRISTLPGDASFPGATWKQAVEYDATKLGSGSASHYTAGLYCPENTLSTAGMPLTAEQLKTVPMMTATHLAVAAQYSPKMIVTATGEYTATSADDSGAKLPSVTGVDENGDPATYPGGSFWFYNNQFYSYDGMLQKITDSASDDVPLTRKDFMLYTGGWGYYLTYIDGDTTTEAGKIGFDNAKSGVLRNYYYILSAGEFKVPGNPDIEWSDNTMKVHSRKIQWNYRGGSTVPIDPNKSYD